MKTQLFAILVIALLFTSCKKDQTNTEPVFEDNIYVSGIQNSSGSDKAVVWKNGTVTTNAINSIRPYYAHSIAVSGTDVYTTGYENTINGAKAHVWKNGALLYSLGDAQSIGNGITVSGNDIYVAGGVTETQTLRRSVVWKNADVSGYTILTTASSGIEAKNVAISGADVYVCGQDINANGVFARIWKNGIAMTINNAQYCYINDIAINGTDVYAIGDTFSGTIRVWKNGISTDITSPNSLYCTAIVVSNNDVYIAGREVAGGIGTAKYWKNGVPVTIGDGIRNSMANGIAVKGNDVYACGAEEGAGSTVNYATVWKNGQRQTIGLPQSRATGIVVK
jgi:hypothetical protein